MNPSNGQTNRSARRTSWIQLKPSLCKRRRRPDAITALQPIDSHTDSGTAEVSSNTHRCRVLSNVRREALELSSVLLCMSFRFFRWRSAHSKLQPLLLRPASLAKPGSLEVASRTGFIRTPQLLLSQLLGLDLIGLTKCSSASKFIFNELQTPVSQRPIKALPGGPTRVTRLCKKARTESTDHKARPVLMSVSSPGPL